MNSHALPVNVFQSPAVVIINTNVLMDLMKLNEFVAHEPQQRPKEFHHYIHNVVPVNGYANQVNVFPNIHVVIPDSTVLITVTKTIVVSIFISYAVNPRESDPSDDPKSDMILFYKELPIPG